MEKYININKKIHKQLKYLLMSTEAIDIYLSQNRREQIIYQKYYKNKKNNTIPEQIRLIMKNIYFLYYKTKQRHIQELIQSILINYALDLKSLIAQQYCKRFKYIYIKTQNNYSSLSFLENMHIQKLAIMNLYIINILHKPQGLYNLVKYLIF